MQYWKIVRKTIKMLPYFNYAFFAVQMKSVSVLALRLTLKLSFSH